MRAKAFSEAEIFTTFFLSGYASSVKLVTHLSVCAIISKEVMATQGLLCRSSQMCCDMCPGFCLNLLPSFDQRENCDRCTEKQQHFQGTSRIWTSVRNLTLLRIELVSVHGRPGSGGRENRKTQPCPVGSLPVLS